MHTTIQISSRFDPAVLKGLIPVFGPDTWGVGPADEAGAQVIIFDEGRTAEVIAALDGYDAHVLARAKAAHVERVAALRKSSIIGNFTFGGMSMKLDPDTENALSKAYSALQRQPEGASIDWEVARGQFVSFDLAMVGAISDAAFAHVQAAFTNQKRLTTLILAAEDLDALNAIDLESGWA